ncbi:substrate-binding domain-containing protein, partial [Streptococcus pneumoniae]|nr:substrate-binding domain-containing protein [Streptococcus pneumoniae]
MKKNVKGFLLLTILVLFALALTACNSEGEEGSGSGSGSGVDVGIVLPTKDEPRWVQDEQRFKDALAESDYSTEILFSQGSSAKEKENVEALLNKGIKVLIITPHDGAAAA